MSDWLPPWIVAHPREPWWLDATAMGLTKAGVAGLPWERTFAELVATERGEPVNVDEGRPVGHTWLRSPHDAPTMGHARAIGETIEQLRALAASIRDGRVVAEDGEAFTDVVHVGIGGSALGPALLLAALRPVDGRRALRVRIADNVDPDGIAAIIDALGPRLRHTLFIIVSKSGGTVETRYAMDLFRRAIADAGLDWSSRAVAITVEGSRLAQQAAREDWLATLPIWDWVGGRFSVTSAVGLFTAELAGIDTVPLLDGAREMDDWTRTPSPTDNPAALLAACWHHAGHGRGDRALVILPYADRLELLSRYLQQLVMESIGKRVDRRGAVVHQGLTVYGNKGSTDQHAYVQQLRDGRDDFFVLFVQVLDDGIGAPITVDRRFRAGDALQGFLLGTRRALTSAGRPSLTLTVPSVDAWSLGGLIALFERTVGLYASLVDLNAYDQPGVEAGKLAAAEILTLHEAIRARIPVCPTDSAVATLGATARAIADALDADPLEVWSVLEHLVATGRAVRTGPARSGRYGQRP
jgi:glucose-6-phosphate isomerase